MAHPIGTSNKGPGWFLMSDGTHRYIGAGPGGLPLDYNNPKPTPQPVNKPAPVASSQPQSSGDSGGGGGGGDNHAQTMADLIRQQLENELKTKLTMLSSLVEEGKRQKGVAKEVADSLRTRVEDDIQKLMGVLGERKQAILQDLEKADIGTVQDYDEANARMVRGAESTQGRNAALARAMGLTGSSGFLRTQQDIGNTMADRVAGLLQEKAGKLSDIKSDVAKTTDWEARQATDIDKEGQRLKGDIDREFQNQVGQIDFAIRNYGIDGLAELNAAINNYKTSIANLNNYIATKNAQESSIGASTSSSIANIDQYAKDQQNSLNNILAKGQGYSNVSNPYQTLQAQTSPSSTGISGASSLASMSSMPALAGASKKNPWEDYIYPATGKLMA